MSWSSLLNLLNWTTVLLSISIVTRALIPTLQWFALNPTAEVADAVATEEGSVPASKKEKPAPWLMFVSISSLSTFGLTMYVAIVPRFESPTSWSDIGWYFGWSTLLWSAGHLCIVISLTILVAAMFNVVYSSIFTIATILAAVPILGEVLRWSDAAGAAVLVVGVAVMTAVRSKDELVVRTWKYALGIGLAVLGGVLTGIAGALDSKITSSFQVSTYMIFRLGLPALVIAIIFGVKPSDVFKYIRSNWKIALATSGCITVSAVVFLEVYQDARGLGFLTALLQLNVFITYFIGVLLKKEKDERYVHYLALFAMTLSVIGVYVMSLKT